MKIILISGKAENGKSTCATFIKEKLESRGKKVLVTRFARYLKMYIQDIYDWDGVTKDEFYRNELQQLGTDIIKEKLNLKAFHAKRLAEDAEIYKELGVDVVIIDDTRFRDELCYMKSMFPDDVISIRVNRNNFESELTNEQKNHSSETDLDSYKFDIICNVDGISGLIRCSKDIVKDLESEI
ncbi:MAG: hypothetical protein ACRCVJ_18690 [Clostridium sp.]|uniref:hypothetical protein n=1 Tax=Clostridium sp. TaxID=1506 RepID=UPI003F39F8EC